MRLDPIWLIGASQYSDEESRKRYYEIFHKHFQDPFYDALMDNLEIYLEPRCVVYDPDHDMELNENTLEKFKRIQIQNVEVFVQYSITKDEEAFFLLHPDEDDYEDHTIDMIESFLDITDSEFNLEDIGNCYMTILGNRGFSNPEFLLKCAHRLESIIMEYACSHEDEIRQWLKEEYKECYELAQERFFILYYRAKEAGMIKNVKDKNHFVKMPNPPFGVTYFYPNGINLKKGKDTDDSKED